MFSSPPRFSHFPGAPRGKEAATPGSDSPTLRDALVGTHSLLGDSLKEASEAARAPAGHRRGPASAARGDTSLSSGAPANRPGELVGPNDLRLSGNLANAQRTGRGPPSCSKAKRGVGVPARKMMTWMITNGNAFRTKGRAAWSVPTHKGGGAKRRVRRETSPVFRPRLKK